MAHLLTALLLAAAIFGHGALWAAWINRLNSCALNYLFLRWVNRGSLVLCALIGLGMIAWAAVNPSSIPTPPPLGAAQQLGDLHGRLPPRPWGHVVSAYLIVCWMIAGWTSFLWLWRRVFDEHWKSVHTLHSETIDIAAVVGHPLAGGLRARLLAPLPGNQVFHLQVRALELSLPKLPPALDGFSIVHLADLHMAGHVGRAYFDEVVRRTNELAGDVILITGDIVDRRASLPWLESTIGRLESQHGVHFVFGNHDNRACPPEELRARLAELGLYDLGGGQRTLHIGGANVLLVGDELPWHKPPPKPQEFAHPPDDPDTLSIVLAHTPDRIGWAAAHGFDLLLAGHLHGGQVRLPLVGPLLSPSRHGVRYSGGTFYRPPTVMHVTRGVSGMLPFRFKCPAEVSKFVLRRG